MTVQRAPVVRDERSKWVAVVPDVAVSAKTPFTPDATDTLPVLVIAAVEQPSRSTPLPIRTTVLPVALTPVQLEPLALKSCTYAVQEPSAMTAQEPEALIVTRPLTSAVAPVA
jgi:hypothetical protein